ncbi:hypothetical protein QA596_08305 [Balneolales bacterium ANBcel1]|nr:hypothetical protein [Balneolales bacterium ANBcel1]
MDKEMLVKVGKYLFALPFFVFGIFHFLQGQGMAGMVPAFIPGGIFWVYLTGLALLAASISVIIDKKVKLAMQLLALMLIIFVLTIHLPATINDMGAAPNLLKDIALAGGALIVASLDESEEPAS